MAENLPIEEEKKTYPRRQKKSLFDDDTWETSTSRKDRKNKRSIVIENGKLDENNKNIGKPACRKCLIVLKDKNELVKHEEMCLIPAKTGSFLKHFPRKPDNPRVILEKIVIPSSQQSTSSQPSAGLTRAETSYADAVENRSSPS